MSYAPPGHWDRFFREHDLDWEGRWTESFLPLLRGKVLELGCGEGHDAGRLAAAGLDVTALDFSTVAVERARERFPGVRFLVADMADALPFPDGSFDAVMANVALHMFDDRTTRAIISEVERALRPGGLLLAHVNSTADRELRARRRRVVEELEPDFVREDTGQTMHFFSREYLLDLLAGWGDVTLEHVEIGTPVFKRVWRVVATRR